MKNNKKILIIVSITFFMLAGVFLLCNIMTVLQTIIEKSAQDMQHRNIGKIIMPNNYAVLKIHTEKRIITHEIGEHLYVDGDIKEIGWNEKIIVFKRVFNNKVEAGYIDMNENKVYILSEAELKEKLNKLQSDEKISLQKVEELFPETK